MEKKIKLKRSDSDGTGKKIKLKSKQKSDAVIKAKNSMKKMKNNKLRRTGIKLKPSKYLLV